MIEAPANIIGHLAPSDRDRSKARKKWIDEVREKGVGCQQIADALGISLHRVYGICRARGEKRRRETFSGLKMLENLSPETKGWLRKERPESVTMEQFIASIITDAYLEETEDGA